MKFLNSTNYPTSQLRAIVTKAIAVARKNLAREIELCRKGKRAFHWRSLGTIAGVEVAYSSKAIYSAKSFGYLYTKRFGEQHYIEVRMPKQHDEVSAQSLAATVIGAFQTKFETFRAEPMRMNAAILRQCKWARKLKLQPKEKHAARPTSTRKASKRV